LKRRISRKVQLIYIGLFALVIGSMLALHYIGTVRQLEKQMISSNQNVLGQINKRIDSMLQDIDLTILNMLRTPGSATFFEQGAPDTPEHYLFVSGLQEQLSSILGANFNMKSVMLYAKRSDRVLTAAGYARLSEAPELARIKTLVEQGRIGKWTGLPESRELLLVRHYPVNAAPADSTGLIAVRINPGSIAAMFDDLQFSDSYNVWLVDRQGVVIAHKDARMMYETIAGEVAGQALTPSGSGDVTERTTGGRRYGLYANSTYSGWKLLYAVTGQQLGAATLTLRYILGGLALFMAMLAVVATRFVNSRWFAPMESLIDRIEEIAAGPSGADRAAGVEGLPRRLGYTALQHRIEEVFHGYTDAERRLREGRPALKLQVLFEVLSGARSRFDAAQPLLEQAGVRLHPSTYIVLTIAYDNQSRLTGMSDLHLYLYALCNVAEELLQSYGDEMLGAAVQTSSMQAAIILSFGTADASRNSGLALGYAHKLRDCIADIFRRTISIGVGRIAAAFDEIPDAYRSSARLLDYKIVVGDHAVITAGEIGERDRHRLIAVFGAVDSLLEAMRQGHEARTHERLEELFELAASTQLTKDMIVQLCLQVVLKAMHATREDVDVDKHGEQPGFEELPGSLESCETLREMRLTVEAVLLRMIARMEDRRSRSRTGELAEAVLAHLEAHYADSAISVNQLAESYRISPNYLSTIFKEHTGRNFVDTLMQLRIAAACNLLLETPLKLNEIALRVGYTNFSSFLRNFKKTCGMTPTEYRALHGGQAREER